MSGIYQIYNPITNKRYIGSSIDVSFRLKTHLSRLRNGSHCNRHLQNAWDKYKDFLIFEFLEECEPDECLTFEQYYLDYYKSYNREFGYNIDPEAKYAGKHLANETKNKIREKAIGRKRSIESIEKVRQFNLGSKKPKQSKKMKDRWDISKTYFGYNCLSEDRKKECANKIRNKTIERYKDFNNKKNNIFLKVLFDNGNILYFHSYHTASNFLLIDRNAIKYALNHNEGRLFKINATFVLISKDEYVNESVNRSK